MKICIKCNENKSKLLFCKNKRSADGYHSYCKECNKAKVKAWREANPEKNKASVVARNIANPEKAKAQSKHYNKIWRETNREASRNNSKAWREANPEKCNNYCAKRRALKKNATPSWADAEFEKFVIQEIYSLARLRTKLTGVAHEVDHIVPLNSNIVQGFHCIANLQILEEQENRSKSNILWPDMPQ